MPIFAGRQKERERGVRKPIKSPSTTLYKSPRYHPDFLRFAIISMAPKKPLAQKCRTPPAGSPERFSRPLATGFESPQGRTSSSGNRHEKQAAYRIVWLLSSTENDAPVFSRKPLFSEAPSLRKAIGVRIRSMDHLTGAYMYTVRHSARRPSAVTFNSD